MVSTNPREVLVVEDEPLVRMVAADAIVDGGIMAWEAGDAHEALKVLDDHPNIGLIFTDVSMPGDMDGLALVAKIADDCPNMALIVTSGHVRVTDDDLPGQGVFLPKPYHTDRLLNLVQRQLDGAPEVSVGHQRWPNARPIEPSE